MNRTERRRQMRARKRRAEQHKASQPIPLRATYGAMNGMHVTVQFSKPVQYLIMTQPQAEAMIVELGKAIALLAQQRAQLAGAPAQEAANG